MAEQPSETIIRRIQSLLAMGSRQEGNEQEAALAMAKAQEMLAKYNLDAYTVEAANVGGTKQIEEARTEQLITYSAMYRWQQELWGAISTANFCWHSVVEKRVPHKRKKDKMVWGKRHMVLGRTSNVLAVQLMGEYLCSTIERLLPYPNTERLSRSAISWREGCADRLAARIQQQFAESQRPAGTGSSTAITLHDVAKREHMANYDAKHGAGSYARQLEWEAGSDQRRKTWAEEDRQRKEKEEKEWLEYLQNESPEQKKAREREEEKQRIKDARAYERESERSARRWEREHLKEATRLDRSAYKAGAGAGEHISLSKQAGGGKAAPALKGGE